ncbi:sialate O-acetylesterase [Zunongwangia sp.]|uniref:sialate O-acetylesterase n=1 Tax=Zunongwangia sp. TaxID=1965325 RepID=UPI003AA8F05C
MKKYFFFIFFLAFSFTSIAQLKLPSVFNNHMVLQRNKPIPIWGKAVPNSTVNLQFKEQHFKTQVTSNGNWKIYLPSSKAGGPFTLQIKNAKSAIEFTDILIGDVWFASGQSNMEFKVKQTDKAEETLANAYNAKLRLFQVPHQVNFEINDSIAETKWFISNSKAIKNFSAIAYNFAKQIQEKEDIPIGIIESTWGGTPVEAWTSENMLKSSNLTREKVSKNKDLGIANLKQDSIRLKKFWDIVYNRKNGLDTIIPNPEYDTSNWKKVQVPGNINDWEKESYEGIIWLKKKFDLKKKTNNSLNIYLGHPELNYSVYVNGKKIAKNIWNVNPNHHYKVGSDMLKDGENDITLRIAALWDGGGLLPPAKEIYLSYNSKKIAITGEWDFKKDLEPTIPTLKNYQQYPSVLYNGMIAPIASYGIKGFIWYQGESNEDNAYNYRDLFPMMITDWRINWKQGYLPFLFVQLPNYRKAQIDPVQDEKWAVLRESQTKALQLANTGMVTTLGLGEAKNIHPTKKALIANRLADLAFSKVYHQRNIISDSPLLSSYKVEKNAIILIFKNAGNGLQLTKNAKQIEGFAIAGSDKKFVWAQAEIIDKNKIKVYSKTIKNPVAVRYAWADNPKFSIINSKKIPLGTFRTDTWKVITQE